MDIHNLQAELDQWLQRPDLLLETNLLVRAEALDFLRFVDSTVEMMRPPSAEAIALQSTAAVLSATLSASNQALFGRLRTAIQQGALTGDALRSYLNQFTSYGTPVCDGVYTSYDGLDILLDGIFTLQDAPAPTREREAEMVHCEETPARAILDLIDHVAWQPEDLFYDLGSGLGQVVMLVNLLTGMAARGVEYEPAFVTFARAQAAAFQLSNVRFEHVDARAANYDEGTIFFLFTPFRGEILRTVLNRLQQVSMAHPIRVCTFGSCTPRVAEADWLTAVHGDPAHEYKLVIFESQSFESQ